ncbi:hypothetical protein PG997_014533 [Apiospora hydei]|uniref:Uncharacterized protein n=1 Tax=Apiospora hydei TaxID=1337664 RepID=A0ABR1UWK5_9PEZI
MRFFTLFAILAAVVVPAACHANETEFEIDYKVIAIGVSKIMTECGNKGRKLKKTSGEAHQKGWYVQIGHSGRHC